MYVLIYDNECNICSRFIQFIVRINKNPELYITDFHSNWTRNNVLLDSKVDSMVFIAKDNKYLYSNSIIHLLAETNCIFKFLLVFKIIPKPLRDNAYKFFAQNRKKIFNAKSCPIPSQKAKKMFLT